MALVADGKERSLQEQWVLETLVSRQGALDDLESRVVDAPGWLAVERQANSLLRHLATWGGRWLNLPAVSAWG